MPKQSAPMPDWFPLKVYSRELTPMEWGIEIRSRLQFQEWIVDGIDPRAAQFILNAIHDWRNRKPEAWLAWFHSVDPMNAIYGLDKFKDRQLREALEYITRHEHHLAKSKASHAVEVMTAADALLLADALSTNMDLLYETFEAEASMRRDRITGDLLFKGSALNDDDRRADLENLRKQTPLIYAVVMALLEGFKPAENQMKKETVDWDINDLLEDSEPARHGLKQEPYTAFLSNSTICPPLESNISEGTLRMSIDLDLDDQTLLDAMAQKLKEVRKVPVKKKTVKREEINKMRENCVLQVFDLYTWAEINNIEFTHPFIASKLWPNCEQDMAESLRRTIIPSLKTIFTHENASRLMVATVG